MQQTSDERGPTAALTADKIIEVVPAGGANPRAETKAFLSKVVPWPGDDPGFINLHYSIKNKEEGKKDFVTGSPFRDLDKFVGFANWAGTADNIKELWYCTSLQSEASTNKAGKPKAVRLHQNTRSLKAIWTDIDIKDDAKHYHSMEEAWAAFSTFRHEGGLPLPSAVVKSGGGLHIYWISDKPLNPLEWKPYAHGLKSLLLKHGVKCDAGLTTDDVRLLRLPNTLNYKYDPPRPVELLPIPLREYDFASELAFLAEVAPALAQTPVSALPASFIGKKTIFEGTDKLSDGIEREYLPLPLDPIVKGCAFIREALASGGKDYSQPMWNLTTLAATFIEEGHALAHKMGSQHPEYSVETTDVLWDRKLRERADRGLGWPRCNAIQANGCGSCASCPHFTAGKSPLHLGWQSASTRSTQVATAGAEFRDCDKSGKPKPTLANAVIAIRSLGVEARLDLFHNRTTVSYNGNSKTISEGLLTDRTVSSVRSLINNAHLIDCGDPNTFAAINEIARDNAFDPVLDMLDDCQGKWDGVKRLDTWVVDYLGCEDTPLNRAIGRSVLVAACRRARVPGCKFDFITVLEGPEGINKSTAIRVLAGDENFNDQSILGASDKEIQEQLEGTWMHENADLAGMRRADVEQVKAFASRQIDRARPAYGRVREDRPRRSIEWATTNNDTYLLSQTGNRRWWTLKTGKVDLGALKHDRYQLLGEAATYEAAGESIGLDESLWADARKAQEQRRVMDPWEDILSSMPKSVSEYLGSNASVPIIHKSDDGFERVASADILLHVLKIPAAQQTSGHGQRLALVMANIGWERHKSGLVTINGKPARGYVRRSPRPNDESETTSKLGQANEPVQPAHPVLVSQDVVPTQGNPKKRPAREYVRHKDYLSR